MSSLDWLYVVSFLHGLGVNSSGVVLPVHIKELGGTEFLVALSMSLFFLARGTFTFVSGALSDVLGRRRPIILAFLLFSVANVCYALSRTPMALVWARAVQAIAAGFYWPVVFALISGYSNHENSVWNISRFLLGLGIGGIVGSWFGGVVADRFSPQTTFWLSSGVFASAGSIFAICIREQEPFQNGPRFRFRNILEVPPGVRSASLLAAGATVVWAVFTVGMPLWLRTIGASYSFIGGTRAVAGGVHLVMVALTPSLSSRVGFSKILPLYLLLCGLSMVGVNLLPSLVIAALLFSLFWGSFGVGAVGWTTLVQRMTSTGQAGASMGVLRGLMDFFALGYLLAFGVLANHWGMQSAFLFVAAVTIILSGVARAYLKSRPVEP